MQLINDFLSHLPAAAAIAIFAVIYIAVGAGRLPGLRIDRAGAAFVGARLMVGLGSMPLGEVWRAIDFDTIGLLLGTMIVVASLSLSGFFSFAGRAIIRRTRRPITLLIATVTIAGVLSAFLVNDAVCLAVTPLVLDLVIETRRNPVPYLLAIAMASNIGSKAILTGNPQNMIIGAVAHLSYAGFAAALSPIGAIGLVLTVLLISLIPLGILD